MKSKILEKLANTTDLGNNSYRLYDTVSTYSNSTFIDLGVRSGASSMIMLLDAVEKQNKVFGVDVEFNTLVEEVSSHPSYTTLLGDSVTLGKNWQSKIEGLFVDTIHVKEQVMCELYYWHQHINVGGFIGFHDSNWPDGKQDFIGGERWPRVEDGIYDFFGIETLNYEDEYIKVENFPESYGMTFVTIKKEKDYIKLYKDWSYIFERRNKLLSNFFKENTTFGGEIELEIYV